MSIKRGVIWDFTGKIFSFSSRFLISIILTRLLSPTDFGLFGAVFVFVNLLQAFIDIGLGAGLVQYKDAKDEDFSTIFWLNTGTSIIIFCLLFIGSPFISDFYEHNELTDITRVLSVLVILSGIRKVYEIRLRKLMNFKLSSLINVIASVLSGVIAIFYASLNQTVWALIIYEIAYSTVLTMGYCFFSNWSPKFYFSKNSINSIYYFSKNYFLTSLINLLFARIDYVLIGKLFPMAILGNYLRAKSFNQYIKTFSADSLSNVLFPYFSKIQDETHNTKRILLKTIRVVAIVSVYLSFILFLISIDLFILLFDQEWLISAEYFRLMSITAYVAPISTIMVNVLLGQGHSKLYFNIELLKRAIYIPVLLAAYFWNVHIFLYFFIFFELLVLLINTTATSKVLNIKLKQILNTFLSIIIKGAILAFLLSVIQLKNIYLDIIIKTIVFSITYFLAIYWNIENRILINNLFLEVKEKMSSK